MRSFFPSLALGTVLIVGLSGNALLAQDQSAPPATAAQPPEASSGAAAGSCS